MTSPEQLLASERSFLVAPAGCGKTETIARSVALNQNGRQLVLTHTHAGVGAIRARLRKFAVLQSACQVETIAGFALRFAASYPSTSGFVDKKPTGKAWGPVYAAATKVLETTFGRRVLRSSFAGVFVDEYQDCSLDQHSLVLALANALPARLLGDPLQAIFGFAGPVVRWKTDVAENFSRLPDLETPHRWAAKNPKLGQWLLDVRAPLMNGDPLDFQGAPLTVSDNSPASQTLACKAAARLPGSVVGIRKWPGDAHFVASRLGGVFGSMEEIDCTDLMNACRSLDAGSASSAAVTLIDFADACMTEVKQLLATARARLAARQEIRITEGSKAQGALVCLRALASTGDISVGIEFLDRLTRIPGVSVYRRELLGEMRKVLRDSNQEGFESYEDAAWSVRDRARHVGRSTELRVISRTLLVKGLEFDHCVVLGASELGQRDLYVAMTRGSSSLTMCVPDPHSQLHYANK